jgi:putative OPT family oligopeptide transporter
VNDKTYAKSFSEQLTLRGLVIGALGSIVIATSSMYVALRMGALPWPTIFVAILSITVLKVLGKTNLNEINVTHTAMSAGGMIAGGVAFTLPGIWMLKPETAFSLPALLGISISGAILGVIFSTLIRQHFVEKEKLPFPMGIAASETVLAGDKGGKKALSLFSTLGLTGIFVALRDGFSQIPSAWVPEVLQRHNIFFGIWISPMASAIGYLIGTLYTGVWFIGALIAYLVIIPLGLKFGFFDTVQAATAFKNSLGIGLMVGTGLGILVKSILPKAREIYGPLFSGSEKKKNAVFLRWVPFIFALVAFILVTVTGIRILPAMLTIFGVWLTTAMAASITGETGINPMEVFGILVLLLSRLLFNSGVLEAFFIAAVVAVSCGLAGDILNDFKAGYILKTNPKAQIISESVGALIGAVVSIIVLMVMFKAYGSMGPDTPLPAPQAYTVSRMISGLPNPAAFVVGLLAGVALYLFKVPGMTLGIGLYLPMTISTAVFLGGIFRFIELKIGIRNNKGVIIASGMLGGEGVTGVIIAISKVLSG